MATKVNVVGMRQPTTGWSDMGDRNMFSFSLKSHMVLFYVSEFHRFFIKKHFYYLELKKKMCVYNLYCHFLEYNYICQLQFDQIWSNLCKNLPV